MRHVGRGLNIWSNVHVDDIAELYVLALTGASAGTFLFAESGEASFRDMSAAIATALGLGEPQPWAFEEAVQEWGYERAALALGSRAKGRRGKDLGWAPRHRSVLDWISSDLRA